MPDPETNEPLTCNEAAEMLGVSLSLVHKLCQSSTLPAKRFGKSWMIDRDGIAKAQKRNTQRGRPKSLKCRTINENAL